MKSVNLLYLTFTLLTGCVSWPEAGKGGAGEFNISQIAPVEADQPVSASNGLRFDFELQRQFLVMLVMNGAQACFPATVSQLTLRENRIARELQAEMMFDAANTLLIQRQQTEQLEQQLSAVNSEGECSMAHVGSSSASQMASTIENLLNSDNQFSSNSSELNPKYIGRLAEAVALLKLQPNYQLQIYGHTDTTGSSEYNKILSEARAKQVARYLQVLGLNPQQFDIVAMGESSVLFEDISSQNRLVNRRVSITLKEGQNND